MSTFSPDEQRRIEIAVAVHDADALPKVADAGSIITRGSRRIQVMHNGVLIDEGCYHGAFMTEIIRRLKGHHEPQEERAFHAVVQRLKADTAAPVMIELGSFWAYYSLWAKAVNDATTCICVEPDPRNLETGRRNFELNDHAATFVHAAVGTPHGAYQRIRTESDNQRRSVQLVSLEGLMRDHGLGHVDLLLSDIQGHETGLLEQSRDLLRSGRVRFMVVSTHHHVITGDPLTHQRCLGTLREVGAHIIAEHSVLESCTGDGLIVASMDERDTDMTVELTAVRARDSLFGEPEYEIARAMRWSGARVARRAQSALAQAFRR